MPKWRVFAMLDWQFSLFALFLLKFHNIFHFPVSVLKYRTDSSIQKAFHDTFSLIYGKPISVYIIPFICQKRKINKIVQYGDETFAQTKEQKHMICQQIFFVCLHKFAQLNGIFVFGFYFTLGFSVFCTVNTSRTGWEIARQCENILSLLKEKERKCPCKNIVI